MRTNKFNVIIKYQHDLQPTIVICLLSFIDLATQVGLLALLLLHEVADLNWVPAHFLTDLLGDLGPEGAGRTHDEYSAH